MSSESFAILSEVSQWTFVTRGTGLPNSLVTPDLVMLCQLCPGPLISSYPLGISSSAFVSFCFCCPHLWFSLEACTLGLEMISLLADEKWLGIYMHTGWTLTNKYLVPSQYQTCLESGQILGCSFPFWVPCRIRLKLHSGGLSLKFPPCLASALLSCFFHSLLVTIGSIS